MMRFWQDADAGMIVHAAEPPSARHQDVTELLRGTSWERHCTRTDPHNLMECRPPDPPLCEVGA